MSKFLRAALIACLLVLISCTVYAVHFVESDNVDLPQVVPVEAYIRDWMALGPFPQDPAGEDAGYIPASWRKDPIDVGGIKAIDGELNGARWQAVASAKDKVRIDLKALYGEKNDQVAYAATYVFADEAGKRELLLGSDDGIAVWLNGEKVFKNYIRRGCQPDQDKTTVSLRKGRNLMVVKVTQALLGWEFAIRFDNNKGIAVSTSPNQSTAVKLYDSDSADAVPRLVIAPYLQNMTEDGVALMWQSDIPSTAKITISNGIQEHTFKTTKAKCLNEIRVNGLTPDTRYTYTLQLTSARGGSSGRLTADNWNFQTFPERTRPVRFIVYGDTRTHSDRHGQVIDAMAKEEKVDFVLHVGDFVGDGRQLQLWIPEYFNPANKMMSRVPFFPCLGNHERNSAYYYQYFSLPMNERWYSFNLPDIHVTVLDSCTDFGPGSEQYKWLVEDLEKHKDIKRTFVLLHHPPYTSGNHGDVDDKGVPKEKGIRTGQEIFPQLAKKYRISAIFTGHDHIYERSTRDGVHYIVAGGGGAPSYGNPNAKHNPYSRSFHSGLSYVVVDVDGSHVEMTAKTPEGKILDKFEAR